MGICPLYYTEVDGWLLWGSEIKALLASGMVAARPDPRGHRSPLHVLLRGDDADVLRGDQLAAARAFSQGAGRPASAKHRYWDLDFPDAGSERRLDDPTPLVEELEALLAQAVERRLRSDVPVVSYISGGLDSTVVLGMCSRQRGEPIPGVHGRVRQGRPRRASPCDGGGRGARLAADHGRRWIDRGSPTRSPS